MTERAHCVLFTTDAALARRLTAYAEPVAEVQLAANATAVKRALQQRPFGILMHDLQSPASVDLLRDVLGEWPHTLVIAIGNPRSDPVLEALDMGIYGTIAPDADNLSVELLLRQTSERQRLFQELQTLREAALAPADAASTRGPAWDTAPLRQLLSPLRHFANVNGLLQGIIDGIASTAVVLRAGIFAAMEDRDIYQFKAGVGCLDETRQQSYRRDAPLVRWLEINAQAVTRNRLHQLRDTNARLMLERALDALGAELIVPLQGRASMLGWLFLGRRATGGDFHDTDIQDVMFLAEHVSTSLENAMLYREVALQKSFAETLLASLPTGVIAAAADGQLYWFNAAAERILELNRADVVDRPVEALGPLLGRALRSCLAGQALVGEQDWVDPRNNRHLSMRAARLGDAAAGAGAVAFVHDRTREHLLNLRQQEVERAAFWTELAASMSHEIRNPMVAIKTFAQLLPERYSDPEFRTEFSGLMASEVDRLNAIIQQINSFAERPALHMSTVNLRELLEEGRNLAALRVPEAETAFEWMLPDVIPPVQGDRHALIECFAHILTNSLEALHKLEAPHISITVTVVPDPNGAPESVHIAMRDNAGGIPAEIRDNVFSPFCTTKARAMGLGLPMVQRTVADHHGHVSIESDKQGTSINITLPVHNPT